MLYPEELELDLFLAEAYQPQVSAAALRIELNILAAMKRAFFISMLGEGAITICSSYWNGAIVRITLFS